MMTGDYHAADTTSSYYEESNRGTEGWAVVYVAVDYGQQEIIETPAPKQPAFVAMAYAFNREQNYTKVPKRKMKGKKRQHRVQRR